MRAPLEAVRLLAQNMDHVLVHDIPVDYAQNGGLIETAALLIVARDKVLTPCAHQYKNGKVVYRKRKFVGRICQKVGAVVSKKIELLSTYNSERLCYMCDRKLLALTNAALLLQVFIKVGDEIAKYLQHQPAKLPKDAVVNDVTRLLKLGGYGFALTGKDTDMSHVSESSDVIVATELMERSLAYTPMLCDPRFEAPNRSLYEKGVTTSNDYFWSRNILFPHLAMYGRRVLSHQGHRWVSYSLKAQDFPEIAVRRRSWGNKLAATFASTMKKVPRCL